MCIKNNGILQESNENTIQESNRNTQRYGIRTTTRNYHDILKELYLERSDLYDKILKLDMEITTIREEINLKDYKEFCNK